jgi:hypothetical protein
VLCYISSVFYASLGRLNCGVASSGKRVLESDCGRVIIDRLTTIGSSVGLRKRPYIIMSHGRYSFSPPR